MFINRVEKKWAAPTFLVISQIGNISEFGLERSQDDFEYRGKSLVLLSIHYSKDENRYSAGT